VRYPATELLTVRLETVEPEEAVVKLNELLPSVIVTGAAVALVIVRTLPIADNVPPAISFCMTTRSPLGAAAVIAACIVAYEPGTSRSAASAGVHKRQVANARGNIKYFFNVYARGVSNTKRKKNIQPVL